MPLVDLKTDLTSLKFGKGRTGDRPGGGFSKEPFIKDGYGAGAFSKSEPLDKIIAERSTEDLSSTGNDMFIRGGAKVIPSTARDLKRLGTYFTTTEGLLFIAQQNLLSLSGVRIYGGYPDAVRLINTAKLNDGVYTPISTLAAAAGVAIGGHPNKQGTDPTGTIELLSRPRYTSLVNGTDLLGSTVGSIKNTANNRLTSLYADKIAFVNISDLSQNQNNSPLNSIREGLFDNKLVRGVTNFVKRNLKNPENLYSYLGGPQVGTDGLGKTFIKIGKDSPSRQYQGDVLVGNNIQTSTREFQNSALKFSTLSQTQIATRAAIKDGSTGANNISDFRKDLAVKPKSFISNSPSYSTKNIEQRVNLGNPGARNQDRSDYARGNPDNYKGLDQINSLYLYRSENVTTDKRKNDLVKFRIAVIDNNNPSLKTFVHFRAFINSFSDTMNATWNPFKYTGRGEDFYTYQGFNNSISIGFTVAVQSIQELSVVYQKLNYLKSSLAPDYSDEGYMRGNIHQLTFEGYFYEVPGIIESLTYNVPDGTPYEIGIPSNDTELQLDEGGITFRNPEVAELPLVINVEMSFKPIYNFLPETVEDINEATKSRFISLARETGYSLYEEFTNAPGTKTTFLPNDQLEQNANLNTKPTPSIPLPSSRPQLRSSTTPQINLRTPSQISLEQQENKF